MTTAWRDYDLELRSFPNVNAGVSEQQFKAISGKWWFRVVHLAELARITNDGKVEIADQKEVELRTYNRWTTAYNETNGVSFYESFEIAKMRRGQDEKKAILVCDLNALTDKRMPPQTFKPYCECLTEGKLLDPATLYVWTYCGPYSATEGLAGRAIQTSEIKFVWYPITP
eukprot:TRINITY_DN9623_c0_g1_i1.p1 TRINITY_DN9623_c0_g1~~TRINITY_DN9623_c0_g1_i1.p1  ORF type:complete len:171 (-),score=11.00 TRINITY_DN9623_c0_g1_i1:212-724(-)